MKWSIGRILYITMLLCLLFGILVTFRSSEAVEIGIILVSLAVASVGAWFSKKWRKQLLTFAIYGWSFLFVIHIRVVAGQPGEFLPLFFGLGALAVLTVGLVPSDRT
jgi:hypothetical protein